MATHARDSRRKFQCVRRTIIKWMIFAVSWRLSFTCACTTLQNDAPSSQANSAATTTVQWSACGTPQVYLQAIHAGKAIRARGSIQTYHLEKTLSIRGASM